MVKKTTFVPSFLSPKRSSLCDGRSKAAVLTVWLPSSLRLTAEAFKRNISTCRAMRYLEAGPGSSNRSLVSIFRRLGYLVVARVATLLGLIVFQVVLDLSPRLLSLKDLFPSSRFGGGTTSDLANDPPKQVSMNGDTETPRIARSHPAVRESVYVYVL